ncbi:MAG: DUF1360 domain-containing protein [Thermoleophilia bacterium]
METTERLRRAADLDGYADEPVPLEGYGALLAAFSAAFGTSLLLAHRRGRLPARTPPGELLLLGVAAHKLARLATKDRVTGVLRAPFTEVEGPGAPGEVEERARGRGARRALGELLTCPFCGDVWVAGALVSGSLHAPRLTRAVAQTCAVVVVADVLHLGYRWLERRARAS